MVNQRIIIIGGGLSGLTLAYQLSKRNINAKILEASGRLGGRIQTINGKLETPLELGATWFSEMHPNLLCLISHLGLSIYPQFSSGVSLFQTKSFEPPQKFDIPASDNPSYRIADGTQMLIDSLASKLDKENIFLKSKVVSVTEVNNEIQVETKDGKLFLADRIVICIPPQLISNAINFSPKFPSELIDLLPNVQTWMAGAIKFVIEYSSPFWRDLGYSGMLYSHSGIISEMYDHTNYKGNKFGFTGFLNGGSSSYPSEIREEFVIKQLVELFGENAVDLISYSDKVWADEFILEGYSIIQRPHQNNGHYLLQQSYMNDKVLFASTETSEQYPGYMEGAIVAADKAFKKLLKY